ncbi:peptidyl-prolyl isomerase cwc27 [Ophiostoma piceae UAMH 11346]|uniref:peptidylprolyl isomerase n=1 Tax=Ophiostoma piceae (strain UAMH 11346) TaxID=1262450 RepID=S3D445_OPHP1|nr:peptidyl-prolyl isomerase cwc27 [Ophiostoma piceae UAMH 11346]
MSSFYDTEPQPTASVILHTTAGEIAVELFAKQTPLTCRNFLQHCLNGYYDDTIFHRIVAGFIVQGGDPTGSGNGGESIYDGGALSGDLDPWPMDERRGVNAGPHGINFKDEFHSRLKFNRRGLLGMANESKPDTNGSQFFFTLDKAEELNGKNTLFGRVAGPTIYNLTKIAQSELREGTERPLYVTKITRVEIVTNPFAEMRKTERDARKLQPSRSSNDDDKKKKNKRKKGVDKKLLSFGDDIEDDLDSFVTKPKKAKVSKQGSDKKKDAREDGDSSKDKAKTAEPEPKPIESAADQHKTTLPSRRLEKPAPAPAKTLTRKHDEDSDMESDADAHARSSIPQKKPQQTALEKTNAEIAALKASMRRAVAAEPEQDEKAAKDKRSALEKLIPVEAGRGKKLSRKNGLSSSDQKTLRMLGDFTSKLGQDSYSISYSSSKAAEEAAAAVAAAAGSDAKDKEASEGSGEVCDLHFIANCQSCRPWDRGEDAEDGDSDSGDDWMAHTLNCVADKLGKDLSYRKKAEDELVVIDPRERERNIKEDKRGPRDSRGGRDGGRGGRSWDQARNAKMSQASALLGRGAR